ncbi:hypothetical protein [Adhaeribacter pallidiroseus]|uniref:Uncharacterized protein n=1 Tax=Adhaeribacter pallidiroseus TaxID=2072847 RepID=A0A369QGZ5_9BACT|nr:hypothetical protein [Adhaeribacter pallidiroseus]RDC63550.1 hypothetical protein AHMF7616_02155 [Adhaeribacter pallidiroseus]
MKLHCLIILNFIALTACNQVDSTSTTSQRNVQTAKGKIENKKTGIPQLDTSRITFTSINQVVQSKKFNAWVELKDSTASLALHFDSSNQDTLSMSYSPECWLFYPFKVEDNQIILYWDNLIDSKYDFDIVKAINKTDKRFIGKPFMTLELINDTTLKATYLIPDLIKKINNSSKERILFPEKFTLSQEFYL